MKTVGETLKKEREEKGLALEEVSNQTKIGMSALEALERSDYAAFPSIVNAKGFLNIYAKFLGIDRNVIDALYRREQTLKEKKVLSSFSLKKMKIRRFIFSPSYVIGIVTIIVTAGILYYLYAQYQSYAKPPTLEIFYPKQSSIETSNDNIAITGRTDIGNNILVDGETIPMSDTLGNFSIPVELHDGINTITVSSQNSLGKVNTRSFQVTYDAPNLSPTPTPSATNTHPLLANLTVQGQSAWITLTIDGKTVLNGVVPPNTKKTFKGKKTIDIQTGRASATLFVVNNQSIPLSGNGIVEKYITLDSSGNIVISPN